MTNDSPIKKAYFAWLRADSLEASVTNRTTSAKKLELAEATARAYATLSALLADRLTETLKEDSK